MGSFVSAAFVTLDKAWTYIGDLVDCKMAEVLMKNPLSIIHCSFPQLNSLELSIDESKYIIYEIIPLIIE